MVETYFSLKITSQTVSMMSHNRIFRFEQDMRTSHCLLLIRNKIFYKELMQRTIRVPGISETSGPLKSVLNTQF